MYGVWNTILCRQFPHDNGYITRPQDRHTNQRGEHGFSDFHTFQRFPDNSVSKFLIVQCKRGGLEDSVRAWNQGIQQLNRYLGAIHGTRQPHERTPAYGILAVGQMMRVYQYDDVSRTVRPTRIIGGGAPGAKLHLENNPETIQTILNHIRDHH